MRLRPGSLVWHRRKRRQYAVALCVALVSLFFLPDSILYARTGLARWAPFILIFGVVPPLGYNALRHSGVGENWAGTIAAGSVLAVGFGFGWLGGLQEDARFRDEGVEVSAVVSEHWHWQSRRNSGFSYKATFQAGEATCTTFTERDGLERLAVGDTVRVEYLRSNPSIVRATDE